jgi:glutamate racemase
MLVDLVAGLHDEGPCEGLAVKPMRAPTILVFDSGLGGLTVYRELVKVRPDATFLYAADDAGFPYGRLSEADLIARVGLVLDRLIERHRPDAVVIACNTASTLVLPSLRARHAVPFVGTVPAVKPAARLSATRHIAVLATPGTVKRDYTHELIRAFAGDCHVTLVGSTALAGLAEAHLRGENVDNDAIVREIAPCFVAHNGARVDAIALACTHYPLLMPRLQALAPWPVAWVDPAPAIARRLLQLLGEAPALAQSAGEGRVIFTAGREAPPALRKALAGFGLAHVDLETFRSRA